MDWQRAWKALVGDWGAQPPAVEKMAEMMSLEEQVAMATAVQNYNDAVEEAFRALLQAHEALADAGFCKPDDSTSQTAKLLTQSLRAAVENACATSSKMRMPLETHRDTIRAASEDLEVAESAESELTRYTEKVAALEGRMKQGGSQRLQAQLIRNQGKLENAEHAASTARTRADDAIGACRGRAAQLRDLGREAVATTATAFASVASQLRLADGLGASGGNKISRPAPPAIQMPASNVTWVSASRKAGQSPQFRGTDSGRVVPWPLSQCGGFSVSRDNSFDFCGREDTDDNPFGQSKRDLEIPPSPRALPQTVREGTLVCRDGSGRRRHLEDHFTSPKAITAEARPDMESPEQGNPFEEELEEDYAS